MLRPRPPDARPAASTSIPLNDSADGGVLGYENAMEPRAHGSSLDSRIYWMSGARRDDVFPAETAMGELAARAAEGDPAAFEQLVARNERRVLTLAWRLVGRMDAAEDAAQEVFLRVFRYLHRFDARKPFAPWIMRITVNVCRDVARERGRYPEGLDAVEPRTGDAAARRAFESPHQALALGERRGMLWSALDRLPRKERAAIVLRDLEGLSTREVAAVLRSSPATVRSQISSARLKIAKTIRRMKESKS